MSATRKKVNVNQLDDIDIMVVGQNCWGRGKTLEDALAKAYRPTKYQAFVCHITTSIDDMGYVSYPEDFQPREILRRGIKKNEKGFFNPTPA